MLPFDPESTSELVRASHIVLVVLESAGFSDWAPAGAMLECREVKARFRIERVLKGELDIPADGTVPVVFQVCRNSGPRVVAVPGIWSHQEIVPGGRFVVFTRAGSKDPAAALREPPAFRVEPAAALPEIEAVIAAATPGKRLPALVAELAGRRELFQLLLARYVAWRLRELLFSDSSGFSAVLQEAENPATPDIFRRTVMTEAFDDLMMLDPAPPVFIARLIWGSVRAIASGPAANLGSRILETYIPNLLGMEGGLQPKNAATVFQSDPDQQREVEEILRSRPDLPGRDLLLTWLAS